MLDYHLDIKKYYSQETRSIYKPYLICCLDLLGFSNHVMRSNKSTDNKLYDDAYMVLSYIQCIKEKQESEDYKIAFFSDSVFICMKLDFNENLYRKFLFMMMDVKDIIDFCFQYNFLIRGGMCIGECIIDNMIFYGPGIIKTYDLQEKDAKCARVIICKEDVDSLFSLFYFTNARKEDILPINKFFLKEDDGYYAYNFFECFFTFSGHNMNFRKCMDTYKYFITSCNEHIQYTCSSENLNKYLEKLEWHVKQYNRISFEYNPPIDDLLILDEIT